jgi:hypothetical protein
MWTKIADFLYDNAPFGVLVAFVGLFGLVKRVRDIELTCARRGGRLERMTKQVDWMFRKMGGNGDEL